MTNEEAKKAGFRTASGALYVYWCIENGHIYVRSCDACALTGNDFPTRAKAREALRKRKMEEAKPSETPAAQAALDKAKDKAKHKPCDMPDEITFNGAEYRRLADNEQHKDGDIPVDGSQTHRFGSIWYRPVASHETPVGETKSKEVVTDETQPTILEEAAKCVTGPRRRDYGTPDENFGLIASLWSVQLKHEVTSMQVAMCLILLKVARQANSPKRDNLVDIAGYAQCASELKGAK